VYFAPILGTLIRANVPDLLDGGAGDSEELAKQAGLHPLSTVQALRALSAFGVFRELAPGTFANNAVSNLFRQGGGLRNYALFATSEQYLKSAMALGHSLHTGQAAHDHALGQKVWEYFRAHPEENEAFNRGLAEIRTDEQAAIAAAYDWTGVKSVVDVGAGAGARYWPPLSPAIPPSGAFCSTARTCCPMPSTCSRREEPENGASWWEEASSSRWRSRPMCGS